MAYYYYRPYYGYGWWPYPYYYWYPYYRPYYPPTVNNINITTTTTTTTNNNYTIYNYNPVVNITSPARNVSLTLPGRVYLSNLANLFK